MGSEVRESARLHQEVEHLKQQLQSQAGLIREGDEASRRAQVCLTYCPLMVCLVSVQSWKLLKMVCLVGVQSWKLLKVP